MPQRANDRVPEEETRLLFFLSGGERFALDIAYVKEIVVNQVITPVPLAPPSVVGVVNHRGRVFTIMSFARLVGLDEAAGANKAVFLHLPDMSVGITVAMIEGIKGVSRRILARAETGKVVGKHSHLLQGIFDLKGRVVHLVDAEELVDTIYRLPDLGQVEAAEKGLVN